jgi:hypothetical protein
MATERDFELLDDYLANRMSGAEKSAFENKLQADPNLQTELSLQRSLIEGIRKSRAAELKAMLQNVPIGAPIAEGLSTGAKLALTTFVAAVITAGIYFYANREQTETVVPSSPSTEQTSPAQPEESKTEPSVTDDETAENLSDKSNPEERKKDASETPAKTKPAIEVFDPTEDEESTAVAADESPRTSSDNGGSALAVEIDRAHSEYKFHYQFRDSKLFLYGPFESNLYEIMEFISDEKTTMFLYHKTKYYLLKDDGDRIKPLTPITDPVLLQKLKEYRKK